MITEIFEIYDTEYLQFDKVKDKKSNRPDLHAFILLDELFPSNKSIIRSATHDKIYIEVEIENIKRLSEKQIVELIQCGVRYESETELLFMFV